MRMAVASMQISAVWHNRIHLRSHSEINIEGKKSLHLLPSFCHLAMFPWISIFRWPHTSTAPPSEIPHISPPIVLRTWPYAYSFRWHEIMTSAKSSKQMPLIHGRRTMSDAYRVLFGFRQASVPYNGGDTLLTLCSWKTTWHRSPFTECSGMWRPVVWPAPHIPNQ